MNRLFFKNLDRLAFLDQVGEFTFESGRFYDMVIDPVIVATSRFIEE